MSESKNYDELLYIWTQWHDNTGNLMRESYGQFMTISNEAAQGNGFSDTGEMWRFDYEDPDLKNNMFKLWEQVKPLYDDLHTYVRHSLIDIYGTNMDWEDDLIPAHLLGNMWAQTWVNLFESIKPFAANSIDVTAKMVVGIY